MREILFRGKRVDNGEWAVGCLAFDIMFGGKPFEHSYIINHEHPSGCFCGDICIEVVPATVGQFTGLTDKDGKRIFEGDVIRAKIEGGNHEGFTWPNMRVEFEQGAFCLVYGEHNRLCNFNGLAPSVSLEVIGNIHDNPELLKGGD